MCGLYSEQYSTVVFSHVCCCGRTIPPDGCAEYCTNRAYSFAFSIRVLSDIYVCRCSASRDVVRSLNTDGGDGGYGGGGNPGSPRHGGDEGDGDG
jgi:hypothetical protein